MELARLPGARENRWAHLLSGTPKELPAPDRRLESAAADDVSPGEMAALRANVARIEAELAAMKDLVAHICKELGIRTPSD